MAAHVGTQGWYETRMATVVSARAVRSGAVGIRQVWVRIVKAFGRWLCATASELGCTAQVGWARISVFIYSMYFFNIQIFSKLCDSNSTPSRGLKLFIPYRELDLSTVDNFPHWPNFKFQMHLLL
jgi:hypothetical protein